MKITREPPGRELIDLLDRVLDRGATVRPSARLRVAANDLRAIGARIVVECIETYADSNTKEYRPPSELRRRWHRE